MIFSQASYTLFQSFLMMIFLITYMVLIMLLLLLMMMVMIPFDLFWRIKYKLILQCYLVNLNPELTSSSLLKLYITNFYPTFFIIFFLSSQWSIWSRPSYIDHQNVSSQYILSWHTHLSLSSTHSSVFISFFLFSFSNPLVAYWLAFLFQFISCFSLRHKHTHTHIYAQKTT